MIFRYRGFLSVVCLFLIVFCTVCHQEDPQADLVLKNGLFFTVNKDQPRAQAIAILGDRILAVGNDAEMDRFISEKSRVIDLKGLFGCPGFNDADIQFLNGGLRTNEVDLKGMNTLRDIQIQILRALNRSPSGSWIVGNGWDQNVLPEKQWPTKRFLDVIVPDVPVYLRRVCGHAVLVNSKALRIADITSRTPNPPGGEIVKNPITGDPTGILKEEAMHVVSQYIPSPSLEMIESAIEYGLKEARKFGITSIQDHSSIDLLEVYHKFLEQGRLTCRISEWIPIQMNLKEYETLRNTYHTNRLRVSMLNEFIDGNVGSQTAAFFQPYFDNPTTRGILQMTQEELNRLIIHADQNQFQVGIHAVGTQGNRMILDAYALAQKLNGIRDSRHRIEYAQILTEEDIIRFHELGVIASVQPSHCIDDIYWIENQIGQERAQYAYPWKSLKKQGTILAFGTDWPTAPLNPMVGLYAAVTRRDTTGYPSEGWYPQERLTVEEAIEAYTLGSAYAEFMDKEKGSLEPGKLADIV
ncbi:amidohydrolase, partial [bacterium]|nr:amidohydrolase [bacterium]